MGQVARAMFARSVVHAISQPLVPTRRSMLATATLLILNLTIVSAQVDDKPASIHVRHWYSYPPSGNRILSSDYHGTFPDNVDQFDVQLPSDVEWIIATYQEDTGTQFVATTMDSKAYIIQEAREAVSSAEAEAIELDYSAKLRSDQPPLVRTGAGVYPEIVQLPISSNMSPLSHPVPVDDGATGGNKTEQLYVYIDTSGDKLGLHSFGDIVLIRSDSDGFAEIDRVQGVNAMPDGRIIVVPESDSSPKSNLLAVYGGATTYGHCVLGDCVESSRLVLIRVSNQKLAVEQDIQLRSDDVFEGICPIALPDGQGIVTTVANGRNGAWLQTYNLQGNVLSTGPYIGWGWRHMLFYNNFGTADTPHLSVVDILTPHVRKIMEFFDISKPSTTMPLQAQISQCTTHSIGSRILDTAMSGDFNGDCINEAVVLDSSMETIKSVQLVDENDGNDEEMQAAEVWSLPLPGRLSSNVAAVGLRDGSGIALAAASGRRVRFWLPRARHGANAASIADSDGLNVTTARSSRSVCAGDNGNGSVIEAPSAASGDDQNGRGKEGTEAATSSATSTAASLTGMVFLTTTTMSAATHVFYYM